MNEKVTGTQKLLIVIAHLSYFIGGIGFVVVPFVIMKVCKDNELVRFHARQALVCHVALLALAVVLSITMFVVEALDWTAIAVLAGMGYVAVFALAFFFVYITIKAAIRGCRGEYYYYPVTGNLV